MGKIFFKNILPSQKLPQPFTHYLNPAELLGVCQILYATIPTMILIGINAINYAVGAPLSTEVKAGIPALLERIAEIVITATGEETD